MASIKAWVSAFRLRTLPLTFSSILSGAAFAWLNHSVSNIHILVLALLTTLFLQVLSNLANDYGDSQHGVDNDQRIGPQRTVQSGAIRAGQMKVALYIFSGLSFFSGVVLTLVSFSKEQLPWIGLFIFLGAAAIWAAIKYTAGKNPYGYRGLGDVFVFLFFGVLGVCGTYFLMAKTFSWDVMMWSFAMGAFSTGVLNVNNMRDIENDKRSGKHSIPVKLGLEGAKRYHYSLLVSGMVLVIMLSIINGVWAALLSIPLFFIHLKQVSKATSAQLDPQLKRLSLSTFFCAVLLLIHVIIKTL